MIESINGSVEQIRYRDLVDHEKSIINDNIFFGYKHPSKYSEEALTEYETSAYNELKALKSFIRDNPREHLVIDHKTQRYIPRALAIKESHGFTLVASSK